MSGWASHFIVAAATALAASGPRSGEAWQAVSETKPYSPFQTGALCAARQSPDQCQRDCQTYARPDQRRDCQRGARSLKEQLQ